MPFVRVHAGAPAQVRGTGSPATIASRPGMVAVRAPVQAATLPARPWAVSQPISANRMASFASTGTPTASDCAVKFTDANDWGNGYVASVDITNTAASPITSWSLAFTWPTGWQQMQGGWNGLWSTSGREVAVTNESFNGTLAPGASTNIGFVAGYQGPNVLPQTFTLNGKLCTTQ